MSKAKKQRIKMEQQGKRNPENGRGNWNGVNPVQRSIPNKKKDFLAKASGY
ncbi:hypothetical protein D3C71_964110 [compost metagenome]